MPVGAASITAWTKVVKGLMVVEPAGALSATVLATPVSMFTPPTAMMVPVGAVLGKKKLPLASVTVQLRLRLAAVAVGSSPAVWNCTRCSSCWYCCGACGSA